jgi:tRNA-dihydrouridine synthase
MPKICRKAVGGALLKDLGSLERLLAAARGATALALSVKMRIGFDDDRLFFKILEWIQYYQVDILFLHARTVQGRYTTPIDYTYVTRAVSQITCPVFANGEIQSAEQAHQIRMMSHCSGVMIGRAAIRYPWIFPKIALAHTCPAITFSDVRRYILLLWEELRRQRTETAAICALKAFLKLIALGINDQFLYAAKRINGLQDLLQLCSFLEERSNDIVQSISL